MTLPPGFVLEEDEEIALPPFVPEPFSEPELPRDMEGDFIPLVDDVDFSQGPGVIPGEAPAPASVTPAPQKPASLPPGFVLEDNRPAPLPAGFVLEDDISTASPEPATAPGWLDIAGKAVDALNPVPSAIGFPTSEAVKSLIRGGTSRGILKASEGLANVVPDNEFADVSTEDIRTRLATSQEAFDFQQQTMQADSEAAAQLAAYGETAPDIGPARKAQSERLTEINRLREELTTRETGKESFSQKVRGIAPLAAQTAKDWQAAIDETIPSGADWKGTFQDQLFEGLGQLSSIPAYVVPGLGEAVTYGQLFQEGFDDAMQAPGMTNDRARQAAIAYVAGAAPLEVLTDRLIVGKAIKGLSGKIKIGDLAKTFLQMGAAGGASEGAQQAWLNTVAKELSGYDPDRVLSEEVGNSVLIGGLVSAIGGSGAQVAGGLSQKPGPTPPQSLKTSPPAASYTPETRGQFKDLSQLPAATNTPAPAVALATPGGEVFSDDPAEQAEIERQISEEISDLNRPLDEDEAARFAEPEPDSEPPAAEPVEALTGIEAALREGDERYAPPVEVETKKTLQDLSKPEPENPSDLGGLGAEESLPSQKNENKRKSLQMKLDLGQNESGFINAEILSEIAAYGRSVFRRGMDFLDWSMRMVRDLGQSVAPVLRRVWDSLTGADLLPAARQRGSIGGASLPVRPTQTASQQRAEELAAPLNRPPAIREAIYIRAKAKLENLLDRNEQRIQALLNAGTNTTHIEQTAEQRLANLERQKSEQLAELDAAEKKAIEEAGGRNTARFMDRIDAAKTKEARAVLMADARAMAAEKTAGIQKRYAEKRRRIESVTAERAKGIASEARFRIGQKDRAATVREELLASIRTLEAVLSVLPPSVRGKIGGFSKLATFQTDEARARYIDGRGKKIAKALEAELRGDYNARLTRLFERTKPLRDRAGKARRGKAGADVHDLFYTLKESTAWTQDEAAATVAALEAEIAGGELSPEQEAHKQQLLTLIPLFADWQNADADRRAQAIEAGFDAYARGHNEFLLKKAEQSERRKAARAALINAAGGNTDLDRKKAAMKKHLRGLVGSAQSWFKNLATFEQLMQRVFGENSPEARQLVNMERQADYDYSDAFHARVEKFDNLFTRLAGGKKLAGQRLQHELMQEGTIDAEGTPLSQMEAVAALLMWRQPKGRAHMIGHLDENGKPVGTWHYGQGFIDAIERQLSPEGREVFNFLAEEYGGEWESINPTYREHFGVNMAKEKNYSPLAVTPLNINASALQDPVTGTAVASKGSMPGSFRQRGHAIAQPKFRAANETFVAHVKQIEYWKAHAKLNSELQSLLGNRDVLDAIEANHGGEAVNVLNKWREQFEQGAFHAAADHLALNRDFRSAGGRAARMALFGGLKTILINYSQLAAGLSQMPTTAFVKRLSGLFTGQLGWRKALASPYIQRRLREMPPAVRLAMDGLKSAKPGQVRQFMETLGGLINGSDAIFTAGTYAIVLDYQLAQAKERGLSGLEAEAYASLQAEKIADRVAQPMRPGTRSILENAGTHPMAKFLWAFASEARKNLGVVTYLAGRKGSKADAVKAIGAFWLLGGLMSTVLNSAWKDLRDDDDDEWFDDENWNPAKMLRDTALSPLYGFPVLGREIENLIKSGAGEWTSGGSLVSFPARAAKAVLRLPETAQGKTSMEDVIKDAEAILATIGVLPGSSGLLEMVADAKIATRMVKDAFLIVQNFAPDSDIATISRAGKRFAKSRNLEPRGLGEDRQIMQAAIISGDSDMVIEMLTERANKAGGTPLARSLVIEKSRETVRGLSPYRVAAGKAEDVEKFKAWARTNLSPEENAKIREMDRTFQATARRLNLL